MWDLNCLEVTASCTLQAAILFLTKTVGKNVLMSVGASEGWALSDVQVAYANKKKISPKFVFHLPRGALMCSIVVFSHASAIK